MSEQESPHRDAHSTRLIAFAGAFVAAMGFGIILLAGGDWIPGGIIVAAALVGFAVQIPGLLQLYRERSGPHRPTGRPAH